MLLRSPQNALPRCCTRICSNLYSTIPDNSPSLDENEGWLNSLAGSSSIVPELPSTMSDSHKGKRFDYELISKVRDRFHIKAPLVNFTSVNYLKRFNNHIHHQTQNNFIDLRIIQCKSGRGGNGAISFHRDANRRVGPPNGGDGGQGGSVYVQAVEGMNSLAKLKAKYTAGEGSDGGSDQLDGASGKDLLIKVPIGTTVRWCLNPKEVRDIVGREMGKDLSKSLKEVLDTVQVPVQCDAQEQILLHREDYEPGKGWIFKDKTEEYHKQKQWFTEFNEKMMQYDKEVKREEFFQDHFPLFGIDLDNITEKPIRILKGGHGGLGNMHFLTSMIRNPRFAKQGRSGIEAHFLFELKVIADLGLVGLPNAGKSTILNCISNAKPEIGHWEFTTLVPTIGTVMRNAHTGDSFTVADIPGIVKDARLDRGMGLEFLKHIERSKGWIFVVSLENTDPVQDLLTLIGEVGGLEKVNQKKILVVGNKADTDPNTNSTQQKFLSLQEFCLQNEWDSIPISALKKHNIELLVQKMEQLA
ncbi:putative GTPase MTG2 KNAG_0E00700 [Huiozyma naganishii CBS 8797]|uniref:Obg family GTPase CgtA n=1 Tax=Huiozyma naganishii (strain ATCC MYA-139 / BCRC 22969 / CBS 8797 / KCTC 17520 / NBRC 10181 / NCYC 3082 / Yp74L-3) TaxID=1071383 RepID=J7RLE2_HUIN7|nr:hypothetical protein KNAG_0E00700 [Kazachstania naganishii CBS 8797]CCK70338.1 hypothetical protein KNAG_0E00700 [Kazachstania naganishii CBS 8797]